MQIRVIFIEASLIIRIAVQIKLINMSFYGVLNEVGLLIFKFLVLYVAYDGSKRFVLKKIIGNKGRVKITQKILYCVIVVLVSSFVTLMLFNELKSSNELDGLTITVSLAAIIGVLEAYRLNKTLSDKESSEKMYDLFKEVPPHSDDRF